MIRNIKINSLKEHKPYKEAIRLQTEEEYSALKTNIEVNGMLDPIRVDKQNRILDGYSRFRVAKELGWESIKVTKIDQHFENEMEAIEWIQDHNIARRHFDKEEREAIVLRTYSEMKEKLGERRGAHFKKPSSEGFSEESVNTEVEPKGTTAKMVAEEVEKKTGEKVSESTVERIVRKDKEAKSDKPKKEKPLPDKVRKVIMFRRTSVSSWEALRWIQDSKKAAQEFVQDRRDEGDAMYDMEIAFEFIDLTFLTDHDKQTIIRVKDPN